MREECTRLRTSLQAKVMEVGDVRGEISALKLASTVAGEERRAGELEIRQLQKTLELRDADSSEMDRTLGDALARVPSLT